MKHFIKSKAFRVLLATAVILLALIAAAASISSKSSPVTKAASFAFSPLSRAASYIAEKFDSFTGGFISASSYRARVEQLEEQVADYQSKLVEYEKLKKQVESYEKFLEIKEKSPDFRFTAGSVIGRDSADTFGSFQLNCGSNDGVEVNDPVISGEYLIGVVKEVTPTTCVVLSICDPKVNAAAYEIRTGELGYTETTVKLAVDSTVKFTGLTKDTAVAEGGIVCTSGVGGVFPRGLIIGSVTAVKKEEGNISYYAEVRPEIDISEVQDAFVITDFEGKGDA
ncbi:MAG: rod shape-determining protein MreC [Ruminococcaceae bacterium]|nr:rod shape-determining protein MreC [Oscillospiraceae bacterium]